MTSREVTEFLLDLSSSAEKKGFVDFLSKSTLRSSDLELLTGLSRENFQKLFSYISHDLRRSHNHSPENALGLFLMKLRLNFVLELLVDIKNNRAQSTVSEIIHRVASLLDEKFTPHFLGYDRSREDLLRDHSTKYAAKLCGTNSGQLIVILYKTYLYIQKSSDQIEQKKTFSLHKMRNLLKVMMVVAMDGEIIEADGIYYGDGRNNDARIVRKIINKEQGIMSTLQDNDVAILDRGFRDCIDMCSKKNLVTLMPDLLKRKQKAFTTEEANRSRKVTFLRWIVEAVNGRIKNMFKFFAGTISLPYVKILNKLFRIACDILNSFSPKMFVETDTHLNQAERAPTKMSLNNELQIMIENEKLATKRKCWCSVYATMVYNFPVLSMEDLQWITMGCYQIEMARYYSRRHISDSDFGGFEAFLHKSKNNLMMAKFNSRFKSKSHQAYVQFDSLNRGNESILLWACTCQLGSRIQGCCSHVASILWYTGYIKDQTMDLVGSSFMSGSILDAAQLDNPDSEDEILPDDVEDENPIQHPKNYEEDTSDSSDHEADDDLLIE